MTLRTNARLAGAAYLLYFAAGITHMVLANRMGGEGTAAKLASIAEHASLEGGIFLLTLVEALSALVLGVTLYALTRDTDRDLAVMALFCRAGEGMMGVVSSARILALLSVAKEAAGAVPADAADANAVGGVLLRVGTGGLGAICFAVGSTLFCYLFLRARSIPIPLAWLGLLGSLVWVVVLPLQSAGFLHGAWINYILYIPLGVFEVTLALWLLIKGVATPRQKQSATV